MNEGMINFLYACLGCGVLSLVYGWLDVVICLGFRETVHMAMTNKMMLLVVVPFVSLFLGPLGLLLHVADFGRYCQDCQDNPLC